MKDEKKLLSKIRFVEEQIKVLEKEMNKMEEERMSKIYPDSFFDLLPPEIYRPRYMPREPAIRTLMQNSNYREKLRIRAEKLRILHETQVKLDEIICMKAYLVTATEIWSKTYNIDYTLVNIKHE